MGELRELRELLLHPRNLKRLTELIEQSRESAEESGDETDIISHQIREIRYRIILQEMNRAEELIRDLSEKDDEMNRSQLYFFHKYKGNYEYIAENCDAALSSYRIAKSVMPRDIAILEEADFDYSVGLAFLRCGRIEEAKDTTRLALENYEKENKTRRIAECHVNLSLCENRMKNFKDTLEHLRKAYETIIQIDDPVARLPIEYNYAYAFLQFQNYDQSIKHIRNCLDYIPEGYTTDRLLSYTMLMKAFIGKEDYEEAKKVLAQADAFLAESPRRTYGFEDAFEEYNVIKLYLEGKWEEFEKEMTGKVIPMMKEADLQMDLSFYYALLFRCYYVLGEFEKGQAAIMESNALLRGMLKV